MRARIIDIARELNLSVSAVSKALRNKSDISQATRAEVMRVAQKLGYKPDPGLSSLAAHRRAIQDVPYTGHLALVSTYQPFETWINTQWAQDLYAGILSASRRLGYQLEYWFTTTRQFDQESLARVLKARGIRGLLILPDVTNPWKPPACWEEFTKVIAFGNSSIRECAGVASHHFADLSLVLEELSKRGYRRPGYILEDHIAAATDFDWLGSFLAHGHLFTRVRPACVYHSKMGEKFELLDHRELKKWMARIKPDVLIANSAVYLQRLTGDGFHVPIDLGYCALSLESQDADVAGIRQPILKIGSTAVEKLVSLLHDDEWEQSNVACATLLHGEWNEGKTLRRPL